VFYGVQTFRHLLPPFVEHRGARVEKGREVAVPCGRVADAPRFGWRGAMLDVSRHFLPHADVKRFIDLAALLKLNRLHLHLTDDQGWRIEIRSWPRLTTHGGSTEVGGGRGGWYSQAEYADLVSYAADRFITIVPEIDLPGHTHAALSSYPALSGAAEGLPLYTGIEVGFSVLDVDSEISGRFVDDVVREVAALTRGPYLHVGGDEVRSLSPAQYARFIDRAQSIVAAHGKEAIGWDEIAAAPLHAGTIVQQWRPEASLRDAVSRGTRVILSPARHVYLDMKYDAHTPIGLTWAGPIDVARAYDWDPAEAVDGVDERSILGVEAPLWTETVAGIRDVEFMAFPRLAAIAEVAWSRQAGRSLEDFTERLGAQAPRWTALGINFHRAPGIPWI
jgi:hexosaminidase